MKENIDAKLEWNTGRNKWHRWRSYRHTKAFTSVDSPTISLLIVIPLKNRINVSQVDGKGRIESGVWKEGKFEPVPDEIDR